MGDLAEWIIIGAMVVVIVCLFALSNQIHSNLQFMLQILDSNQKAVLERLEHMRQREQAAPAAAAWDGMDRRVAMRRSPAMQAGTSQQSSERRCSRGRRRSDQVNSGAMDSLSIN